jgi:integrase/recombinase XerD
LLNAALELPVAWPSTPLRPWVFHCLIGLLSVTGLRISEALNLELGDVDLEDAVLTIRGAKLGRSRLVPIHPTTCTVLADYLRRRKQFLGRQVSSYVFVTSRGTRLDIGRVHRTFYALSWQTGLRAEGASKGPRLHDFRHNSEAKIIPSVTTLGAELPALRYEQAVPVLGIIRGSSGIA